MSSPTVKPKILLVLLVAVTGYALPEDRRRAAAAGFAHHLAKPLALDELDRLISVA